MSLLLQVFGVIFLLILLFGVVAILTIRAKLRGFLKTLEGLSKTMAGAPSRITLIPLAASSWANPAETIPLVESLKSLGFEKVGNFQIREVDGMEMEAWMNSAKSVTSVIYEHPKVGVWLDFWTHFQDGTRMTFANTHVSEGIEHAPGHDYRLFPGMDARELFEKFLAARPDKPAKPVSAETFVSVFEQVYAEEQDWRNLRGGASVEEIRAIGMRNGETYDEDVIQATHEFAERHALEELDETIRERFLEQTKMSAVEWERVRDRVIVIHDKMNPEVFEDVVGPWLDDEEFPDASAIESVAPRQFFDKINESLPANRRFIRLGTVSSPVEADVYAVPES